MKESTCRHHSTLTASDDGVTPMISHSPSALTASGIHLQEDRGKESLLNVLISSQLAHLFHLQSALVSLESRSSSSSYPSAYLDLTRQISRLHLELANPTAYIKTWDAALLRLETVLHPTPTTKSYHDPVDNDAECVSGEEPDTVRGEEDRCVWRRNEVELFEGEV